MVDTQHFCLRWNNYQSSITSAFENLRDDEDFVDVTLACDGKSLKAHRVVLSACSPYFRELLKSTPCKHPVIVLQDVAWTDLHALVEFIYHGEVNVHQRSLSSFLKTAEVLRVSGLTQQHGDDREQLAQVQSLVRSQQSTPTTTATTPTPTPTSNHHTNFADKLVEDVLFNAPTSPPAGHGGGGRGGAAAATVNQILRHVALQHRRDRDRRPSSDHPCTGDNNNPNNSTVEQLKRARNEQHVINNNNNINNNELNLLTSHNSHSHPTTAPPQPPPQTQPADFSPNAMKNNALNLNINSMQHKLDGITPEGNGISSTDRENSPCSPSPTLMVANRLMEENNISSNNNTTNTTASVKPEPMDILCGGGSNNNTNQDDNSNDSGDASLLDSNGPNNNHLQQHHHSHPHHHHHHHSLPQGPHSGGSSGGGGGGGGGMGDHEDHDGGGSPIGQYFTSNDSKQLFATAAGSFNFSMAALSDPTGLGGLNQSLQANADSLAGTSQGPVRMPPPTSGGINEPQECPFCRRTFSCYYSLKRHFQDKHEQSDTLYLCEFCHRRYRTKNSLTTHKSLQHRGSSGMLKRLLKTTAIKSVLGGTPPPRLQ